MKARIGSRIIEVNKPGLETPQSGTARKLGANSRGAGKPVSGVYRSKWEVIFAQQLDMEMRAGGIRSWRYEGITFRLAKGKYHRIDFVIGHNDGTVEIAQIKGWHKNLRAGIAGLKWAAQLYPMFVWTLKHWSGRAFESSNVEV